MDPTTTWALGIDLLLLREGGRQSPLLGGHAVENRFKYRPNWGLPGWPVGEQTAAPVLGFSKENIQLGESARAVIVPLFLDSVPAWAEVRPGDELRMYEGPRICGMGTVLWIERATWPTPADDQERLATWLSAPLGERP
ncbi:hypothetical protein AB4Y87_19740 [Paenarthrobacter sp. RAF54_2]|uniref:hypothetical protein n=1 Tax=Paenarthrobacter sp. RAF54_2 TaxID=3233061 RepID=UPI003F9C7802